MVQGRGGRRRRRERVLHLAKRPLVRNVAGLVHRDRALEDRVVLEGDHHDRVGSVRVAGHVRVPSSVVFDGHGASVGLGVDAVLHPIVRRLVHATSVRRHVGRGGADAEGGRPRIVAFGGGDAVRSRAVAVRPEEDGAGALLAKAVRVLASAYRNVVSARLAFERGAEAALEGANPVDAHSGSAVLVGLAGVAARRASVEEALVGLAGDEGADVAARA